MRYFGFNEPSFNVKRFGFAFSRFTPTELFANGEQGVWFDPSDISTMFQDVEGIVPVTKDGDPVALMKDKSGNGIHATQVTASARPIYKTDGALHWLQFDGVDDYMETLSSFLPRSIVVAMINNKEWSSPGFALWDMFFLTRHNIAYYTGETATAGEYGRFVSTLADLSAIFVASLVMDSPESRLTYRGVSATNTGGISGTPTTATKLYLGARVDDGVLHDTWRGQVNIFEMIITERVLNVNEETVAADHVASNIGITT